jgi:hypothetical protein
MKIVGEDNPTGIRTAYLPNISLELYFCTDQVGIFKFEMIRCNISEDSALHNDRCDNLKSYLRRII